MSSQSERIKQRRMQLGMSQEELAFKVGTTQKQISRYERGVNDPTGEVLSKLADALNTSADYILCRSGSPDREVTEDNLDALETEIFELLRSQPEDTRRRALGIIKALTTIPDPS